MSANIRSDDADQPAPRPRRSPKTDSATVPVEFRGGNLSRSIDDWARTIPTKTPLQRDEKLWAAFAEDREAEPFTPRTVRPTNCLGCNRPLRTGRTRHANLPDAVEHRGHGLCKRCHDRKRRGLPLDVPLGGGPRDTAAKKRYRRPDNCDGCERPLRSKGQSRDDYPGTVLYAGNGICTGCEYRRRHDLPLTKEFAS